MNAELQAKLDVQKWLDSETKHKDMCGCYDYCAHCNKMEITPCANAYARMEKANPIKLDVVTSSNSTSVLGKKFDLNKVMDKKANRKSLSFAEKYALADDTLKLRYLALQNALIATEKGEEKIKSRISKQCDTYRQGGDIVAKVTIIGSSLRINLSLDCDAPEYNDGKTPHTNEGGKKVYEEVPFQFKVNSKLALKRALALIQQTIH
ncbi:MAG: hypothetical protein RR338_04875 [Clostridia bacterium]